MQRAPCKATSTWCTANSQAPVAAVEVAATFAHVSDTTSEERTIPNDARIAVIGAGALGCALLPRLARLRIATLSIIDGDRVEGSNLERQALYAEADIGHPKVTTARGWLQMVGPGIDVVAIDRFIDPDNAQGLLEGHHLVVDCTDDLHAKQLIDRACADLRIPLVSGAVHLRQGQVILLHAPGPGSELSRADLFKGKVGADQDGCDMRQVPEATIEAVGARMAGTIRSVLTQRPVANGSIAVFDLDMGSWSTFDPPVNA